MSPIVTVFRSRLRPGVQEEYQPLAARMSALAREIPGYVSHKTFVAEDGERVTLVEFADEPAQQAWSRHPEHVEAKRRGRAEFYSAFRIQVCRVERESQSPQPPGS